MKFLVGLKKIKSVINLRGSNPHYDWYNEERHTLNTLNIQYFEIPLNSTKLPTTRQLQQLTNIIRTAQRPILIHCATGVDRSGLASAISMILLKEAPLKAAEQQFSWRYWVTSRHSVGKQVFAYYHGWLQRHHIKSSKTNFIRWVFSPQPLI